ncbi:acyl-CoA thioesterase [Macrococcus armenti]|uniref:acyl-CoA thioesterase n=1 Tax=Macrococcus armenti TaxID=2875764 RepID=UPI001CCA4A28|nr:thioesterase family protein [Macrococcus armenti]UBH09650.1 acyl-CoA thioesterase [Macrococcus armenti]UBH11924.1 acyl-CoA thioesterase [Macrococcus armenti]UBH16455.1 acyl-CoA thioesterase [Macrococcus armenti]UBH18811.1 acyl-CoA thioesterase [Macrococcus armenti]UBH21083.1 acyl-CoA thioesterase [Macrococcus armenti]
MYITEKKIDVRYAETDKMGVVYHANYLVWFEVGRTDFIKKAGFNYQSMEDEGLISPVLDVQVKYKQSVTYPESVIVKTWIDHYSKLKTIYAYEVIKEDGSIAATGKTTHVIIKKGSEKPVRLDRYYPEWHAKYLELSEK